MQTDGPAGKTIQSVESTGGILAELRRTGGATVTELSEAVDLSPGAVHTHLATLKQFDFVEQEGTTYRLGPGFLLYGAHVRNNNDLFAAAKGQVDELAKETGEIGRIVIEHGGKLLVLHEKFGPDAVGRSYHTENRAKAQRHIHCTAAGKAILAHTPAERVDEIIDGGLPQLTPNTITDPDELRDDLSQITTRGYALNDEEQLKGIRAIGAAVTTEAGDVIGAISLAGPTSRISGETFADEYPEKVLHAANLSEVNLQTGDADL